MTTLPAPGYFSVTTRTNAEAKAAQDAMLAALREMPGGDALGTLVLSGDAIVPTGYAHNLDTEGGAASDTLQSIATTNHPSGRLLLLRGVNAARVVTIKHNAQCQLAKGVDFVTGDVDRWLLLINIAGVWREVLRSWGTDVAAERAWLGLGSAATKATGTGSGDVPTIADADARYARIDVSNTFAGTVQKISRADQSVQFEVDRTGTSAANGRLRGDTTGIRVGSLNNVPVIVEQNSVSVARFGLGGGLRLGNPTGPTDPGGGVLNAEAVRVGNVDVLTGNVKQGHLSTSTGEVSTSSTSLVNVTLPGGEYGFWPQVKSASGYSMSAEVAATFSSTTYAARIALQASAGGTAYARQRYITASPPYDLGDGPMNGFAYGLVDKGGRVVATYIADVPPWAYNGPTRIRPDLVVPGTGEQLLLERPRLATLLARGKPPVGPRQARRIKLTQALKNRDMKVVPHPFIGTDLTGLTVVLFDPMDPLLEPLLEDQNDGDSVGELFLSGRIRPDNEPLERAGPPGVMTVRMRY